MIALEIEGGIFGGKEANGRRYKGAHSSVTGMLRDIEKYNAAAVLGWRVLRVTPDQLFSQSHCRHAGRRGGERAKGGSVMSATATGYASDRG